MLKNKLKIDFLKVKIKSYFAYNNSTKEKYYGILKSYINKLPYSIMFFLVELLFLSYLFNSGNHLLDNHIINQKIEKFSIFTVLNQIFAYHI